MRLSSSTKEDEEVKLPSSQNVETHSVSWNDPTEEEARRNLKAKTSAGSSSVS